MIPFLKYLAVCYGRLITFNDSENLWRTLLWYVTKKKKNSLNSLAYFVHFECIIFFHR